MFSGHLRAASALAIGLLCGSAAAAQTGGSGGSTGSSSGRGGIAVNPISIDGEDVNTFEGVRLGIAECDNDSIIVFELDGIPADKNSIDIYKGENCNQTDRNNTDVNRCDYITTLSTNGQTQDLRIELSALPLFDNDCSEERESEPTLWFLAVDDPESSEDVGNGFGTYDRLLVDGLRPRAPTNVRGGTGESTIRISWETDQAQLQGFRIYIDSDPILGDGASAGAGAADGGAASTGDCGSRVLMPMADPRDLSDVTHRDVLRESATGFDLDTDLIDGDAAAVAVVAIDEAGNESLLSNIGCVRVQPTEGFWDRYRANGGEDVSGCPCSALGPAQLGSAWPVALSLLVLVRAARRRRTP